ncbi:MAG: glycosyltransferase family 2 protein [Myxococcales bacterium]|nr:glycosyltransferase family 2 protein [Myxococcales bacterium]
MRVQDRVSVLTPSYNQARFLLANLDSVRAQGAVVREHIVVDGGSTDGSTTLLAGRQDARLRWISEPDHGQSDALNKALRWATGDVIGWLNSDDVYLPGAARRAVELLNDNPHLGMVFGHCYKIDEQGRLVGQVTAHNVTLEDMLCYDTIPQPSCFVRREVLERAGGLDVTLHYAMDYDLWLRIGLLGVAWRAVDEVWAGFRVHSGSKSSSEADRFLPEVERAMERALASPALPPELACRRPELRRRFHTNVGLAAYANLDLATARRELLRAARAEPAGIDRRLVLAVAKSLLGKRLVRAARRLNALGRSTPRQSDGGQAHPAAPCIGARSAPPPPPG